MRRIIVAAVYRGLGTRVAIVEDGRFAGSEWEPEGVAPLLGQIHCGEVLREAKGMRSVYVRLNGGGMGLLHHSDIVAAAVSPAGPVAFPPTRTLCHQVENLPRPGTAVIVQIKREGDGPKLPQLTTDISFPGRRFVLRPYRPIRRISKELMEKGKRDALHEILRSLAIPGRAGLILRTAGINSDRSVLTQELEELAAGWEHLIGKARATRRPSLLYQEPGLLDRVLRDEIGDGTAEIVVDDEEEQSRLQRLADAAWGEGKIQVKFHQGPGSVFSAYGVEKELANLYNRELSLRSGGGMVIDYTEALVAVDVNSGSGQEGAESTAVRTNLEAAEELFRQLRLRDIGGLIVCDFIAMQQAKNRKRLEERLRSLAEEDRGNVWLAPLSKLGFVALTRRAQRPALARLGLAPCPACGGRSWVAEDHQAAASFLEALLARDTNRETAAQVSPGLMAILSKSEAFKEIKKKFGRRLKIAELSHPGWASFEIQ